MIFALLGCLVVYSTSAATFSNEQKKAIEEIVHNYLINKPEVLIEASKSLQEKQQQEMLAKAQAEIPKHADSLFKSKVSPVLGNANGDIYVVEFLDYACGHCRKMHDVLVKLMETNKSLKIIIKEFPIFGGVSDYSARMALAANRFGKYAEFHKELFAAEPPLTDEKVDDIIKKLNLDMAKMKKYAESEDVDKEMENNINLAQQLGILGTPAFVLAAKVDTPNIKTFYLPGSATFEIINGLLAKLAE